MSPDTVGYLGLGFLMLLLIARMHVGLVMIFVGFVGYLFLTNTVGALGVLATAPRGSSAYYTLTIIPLFIFMGQLASYSGLSEDMHRATYKLIGHVRGGLPMAIVITCAGFAAICGSSLATVVTMTEVALPSMRKYGYDVSLATGAIAAGGTLGILIPPSVALVMYGIITQESIGKLFIAGILPGILLTLLFLLTIMIRVRISPNLSPRVPKEPMKERILAYRGLLLPFALFMIVMGGIYTGVFTPTEAAAIGAFSVFLSGLLRGGLGFRDTMEALKLTGKTTGMIFLIMIGAGIFSYFLGASRVPYSLARFVTTLALSKYLILAIILFGYLLLGCMMEAVGITLLTVPIIYPLVVALGFDPIWYGIIFTISMEMGLITPPVGMNVFAMHGADSEVPLSTIFRGVIWFLPAMVVCIVLLTIFPEIVLFLPRLMG
ncbi:MAG: TRAP transporter large permease [Deltaproteobacteria bacterium]|nr:TRAP transporter large permease [Deltaproteobacteria bacterium]